MATITLLGLFVCLVLIYKYVNSISSNFTLNPLIWYRKLKHGVFLYLMAYISWFFAVTILSDQYNVPQDTIISDLWRNGNTELGKKVGVMTVLIWIICINMYYLFFIRKYSAKKEISNQSNTLNKNNNSIKFSYIISAVTFIFLSIAEGFFQDLFYEPFIKPFFCNYFNLLCHN